MPPAQHPTWSFDAIDRWMESHRQFWHDRLDGLLAGLTREKNVTLARQDNLADSKISMQRVFNAPRALVFASWTNAEDVAAWFAPDGFTVLSSDMDATPGGRWRVTFRSDAGEVHEEFGEFIDVREPDRLEFSLTQRSNGKSGPKTTVTVEFTETGGRTHMAFQQSGYASKAMRNGNAEGWAECFRKLEAHLTRTLAH
jgi:uncharacterized protein YndB with AHSA1/START domain